MSLPRIVNGYERESFYWNASKFIDCLNKWLIKNNLRDDFYNALNTSQKDIHKLINKLFKEKCKDNLKKYYYDNIDNDNNDFDYK
jgi:hypothetical protein